MILLSQLLGQESVALGSARRTGSVKGIVLDGRRITGVELSDGLITADAVRSFEGDVPTSRGGDGKDFGEAPGADDRHRPVHVRTSACRGAGARPEGGLQRAKNAIRAISVFRRSDPAVAVEVAARAGSDDGRARGRTFTVAFDKDRMVRKYRRRAPDRRGHEQG